MKVELSVPEEPVGSKTTYDNYIKTCDQKAELPSLNCS
jgi:hypothetical protein